MSVKKADAAFVNPERGLGVVDTQRELGAFRTGIGDRRGHGQSFGRTTQKMDKAFHQIQYRRLILTDTV
nr:hypothetical protein [Methylomonas sp. LWB]